VLERATATIREANAVDHPIYAAPNGA